MYRYTEKKLAIQVKHRNNRYTVQERLQRVYIMHVIVVVVIVIAQ